MRGPTPETLMSSRNSASFTFRAEAEQHVRILAHDQVRVQAHLGADGRQAIERRHRSLDLVTDTADVDHSCGGCLAAMRPRR